MLFVNQYFWPDVAATAQLLADLASDLAKSGVEVEVLTGRGRYVTLPGAEARPANETWRGVEIRRVPCTSFGRGHLAGRLCDYGTFFFGAGLALLHRPVPDVVVCLSTPPFVAILGGLARRRGARFVYKVEDLYPDVAVALGKLRSGSWMARFLARLSRWILRRADVVVALDSAMADTLENRGARRVEVIPNWADGDAIGPSPEAGRSYRRRFGWDDSFVVLYSGNIGLAHRFDALLAAARKLGESRPEILFVFVGDGPRRPEIERAAASMANVELHAYRPREELNPLYAAADLHVVSLRDEVAGLLVPSKYSAALAAGKQVLLLGGRGSDLHDEISIRGLGWTCGHDADDIVRALEQASSSSTRSRAAQQASAREVFEAQYDRKPSTEHWYRTLSGLSTTKLPDDPRSHA